jgi:hypothetical protein
VNDLMYEFIRSLTYKILFYFKTTTRISFQKSGKAISIILFVDCIQYKLCFCIIKQLKELNCVNDMMKW